MLTNAHVVGIATHGVAALVDGTETDIDVVGADELSEPCGGGARPGLHSAADSAR